MERAVVPDLSYCSATGKALLAFLPRPDLDQLLDRMDLVQRGPRTVI
jgi:DNA-binding IclR family transcriptional regulator